MDIVWLLHYLARSPGLSPQKLRITDSVSTLLGLIARPAENVRLAPSYQEDDYVSLRNCIVPYMLGPHPWRKVILR